MKQGTFTNPFMLLPLNMKATSTMISFKNSIRYYAIIMPVFGCLFAAHLASAQCVSLTSLGSAVTQNFDALSNVAGSTMNNLTIPGWHMTESGGGTLDNEQYAVSTGSLTAGDTYSFGSAGSTDRALGGLRSGTLIPLFGACFTNNTGSTIASLTIAYTGEEWRLGTASRTDQINFEYSLNSTDLTTGTWTGVAALNFITPVITTIGAKDGNAAANQTALSATITGLSIPNGATFWIRWTDTDASGADDGLAVDDFSLTPNGAPPSITYYRDMDMDGYGDPNNTIMAASQPAGYVLDNTDCVDTDASVHPGAMETCNGCDKDCDGFTGDGVAPIACGPTTPPNCVGQQTCIQQAVPSPGACLPGGGTLSACSNNPQPEICDGIDNNCNGMVDDGVPPTPCVPPGLPPGLVYGGTSQCRQGTYDCISGVCIGFVGPGPEVCDGIDNDCDGIVDEGVPGAGQQCEPQPGIVYGGNSPCQLGIMVCVNGSFVCQGGVGPAPEICDGVDNDCDGVVDDGVQSTFYADSDMDGFGDPNTFTMDCMAPEGFVSNNLDCNDDNANVNPNATEACNGIDDDCDLMTDEGCGQAEALDFDGTNDRVSMALPAVFNNIAATDFSIETWVKLDAGGLTSRIMFAQKDGNNFTSLLVNITQQIFFYVSKNGIQFTLAGPSISLGQWTHIAATWVASTNTLKLYYDGVLQSGTSTGVSSTGNNNAFALGSKTDATQFLNGKLDEFRVWSKALSVTEIQANMNCEIAGARTNLVMNYHFNQGIAGGNNAGITTLLDDSGNSINGTLNNFALTGTNSNWIAPGAVTSGVACTCILVTYYADTDQDGYGDPNASQEACSQPEGYVTDNTDCNDNDANVHSLQLYYVDSDLDGFGSTTTAMLCSATAPEGYSVNNTDCNDNDASVHNLHSYFVDSDLDGFGSTTTAMLCSATEPEGYSINNTDCNDNDPSVHTPQLYYVDADMDGYGSTTTAMLCSSTAPTGYSANNTDCNDNDASIHSSQLYYVDADMDGYGSTTTAMLCSSTAPAGYSTNNTDCNDNDASIHSSQLYYVDADMDGYGSTTTAMLCSSTAPTGYSANNTDCNDNDNTIYPGAPEICDGKDNNCNSQIDESQPVPAPWATTGIGETGSSVLDPCPAGAPQFVVNATGYSPNVNNDAVQVTYQTLCSNSSITVHVTGVSGGGWAGITMRESTATGSKMVALKTQLTNFVRREVRSVTGGPKSTQQIPSVPPPSWLRIQRSGNIFSFYTSTNGTTWSLVGTQTVAMNNCLLVGMFAESININTTTTATFDNVSVSGSGPIVPLAGVNNPGFEVQESTLTPTLTPTLILYPNPTNGQLVIGIDNAPIQLESVVCTVYNSQGQQILQRNIAVHGQTETIDLSSYANGVYWVRIQGNDIASSIRKVVKVNEIRP